MKGTAKSAGIMREAKMSKGRPPKPMAIEDRAKQFAPFAALTGFGKVLSKMEKVVVDKPDLSEEALREMDETIHMVDVGDMVSAIYYRDGECLKIEGILARLDIDARIIQIVADKIEFDNLLKLELIEKKK